MGVLASVVSISVNRRWLLDSQRNVLKVLELLDVITGRSALSSKWFDLLLRLGHGGQRLDRLIGSCLIVCCGCRDRLGVHWWKHLSIVCRVERCSLWLKGGRWYVLLHRSWRCCCRCTNWGWSHCGSSHYLSVCIPIVTLNLLLNLLLSGTC